MELNEFNEGYNSEKSDKSLDEINIEVEDNLKYDISNLEKYKKEELFDIIKNKSLKCKVNKKSLKSDIIKEIKQKLC